MTTEIFAFKFALTITAILFLGIVLGHMLDSPNAQGKLYTIFFVTLGGLIIATPVVWVLYLLVLLWS